MDNKYTNKSTDEFLKDKVYILNEEELIKNMINPINRKHTVTWSSNKEQDEKALKDLNKEYEEYVEENPWILNELNPIALDIDSEILAELLTSKGVPTAHDEAKESLVKQHYEKIRCKVSPNSVTIFEENC